MIPEEKEDEDDMDCDTNTKPPQVLHPATTIVEKFIENSLLHSDRNVKTRNKQVLHLLVLLRNIIMVFPKKQLKVNYLYLKFYKPFK